MAGSVDGLISGLSTSDLISKLMQVESAGQTRLKTKITSQQSAITSFQSVNTRVAALKTAATALTDASTWSAAKASSSSDAISVTAGSGATTGKLILDMKELAQATTKTSTDVPGADLVNDGTGLSITIGETTTAIAVEEDTPEGVAAAINKAGLGVNAAVITSSGQGKVLQLTAANTGTANDFTVNGLNVDLTTIREARDAKISVGTVGAGGYEVISSSNTFTNLVEGVTITANRIEDGITVSIDSDTDSMTSKVKAMVDAANSLTSEIATRTSITTSSDGSTTGASLAGNSLVRQLQQSVLSTVSGGMADYGSFKQLGIEIDRYGKLTFDEATFKAAYEADPAKTENALVNGLGKGLSEVATAANTNLTSAIQSGNNTVRMLNDQVDNWTIRLNLRQATLEKQFSNLEVALGKLQDQSTWLSGQISSLSSSS